METEIFTIRKSKPKKTITKSTQLDVIKPSPIYQISPFSSGTNIDNIISTEHPQPSNISDPPGMAKITYVDDLDILTIHQGIIAKFSAELGSIDSIKSELKQIEFELNHNTFTRIETLSKLNSIEKCKKTINELESGSKWNKYINLAKPLLESYIPLSTDAIRGVVNVRAKTLIPVFTEDQVKRRLIIINDYLEIARLYIEIDVSWKGANEARCPGCGCKFSEIFVDDESGLHKCKCGYQRENLSKLAGFNDPKRVSVGGRNNYNDEEIFLRSLHRLQGKIIDTIPKTLYEQLDDYFTLKSLPVGEEIKILPLLPNGKKANTSINQLISALDDTNNAFYYNNINLITHNYWGWNLPDYSEYEDGILEDYHKTQKVYEKIKTRDSNLNVIIRIFLHLKARDCPCVWEDFKILSSRESLEYHREMWKEMCEQTGIKYYELI